MGSLYQRALALRKKFDHDIEILEKNLGDELEQWITPEERRKIFIELGRVSSERTIEDTSAKLSFTPERNDRFFPLLFNIAVVVATTVGILLLVVFFTRGDRTLAAAQENLMTAEARLFASFRQQTEEQLTRKDREIQDAQRRLEEMSREREQLRQEGEILIAERAADLQAEMESRLEQERQKLTSQDLDASEITSRLGELEQQLSRSQQEELEVYKRQVEEESAAREASLNVLMSEYDQNLVQLQADRDRIEGELKQLEEDSQARIQREQEILEQERTEVQRQLAGLQGENEKERLALDQILSGYARVSDSLQIPDYQLALQQLDVIQSFLSLESVSSLPAIQRRRPVELFIIQSLRELVEKQRAASTQPTTNLIAAAELLASISQTVGRADSAYQNGNTDRAKELYVAAIEMIPTLKQSYPVFRDLERLSLQTEIEAQIASTNRQLEEQRSKLQSATDQLKHFEELQQRIRETDEGFERITAETIRKYREDELLSLLETKLRLNEVLSSNTVTQDYPDLYENVETYLRMYGRTFENEGKSAMLGDVVTLLQALAQGESTESLLSIVAPYEEEELQQLLQQFFTILYGLVE